MLPSLKNAPKLKERASAFSAQGRWSEAADAFQKLADIWYHAIVQATSEEARSTCMEQFKASKAEAARCRANARSDGLDSAMEPSNGMSSAATRGSDRPTAHGAVWTGESPAIPSAATLRGQLSGDAIGQMLISQVDGMKRSSGVSWDDIGGMDDLVRDLKTILAQSVMRRPDGSEPEGAGKILLVGPAGTGKTLLVAAIARSLALDGNGTFFEATPASLQGHYKGNTPKSISLLYETARENAPSVVFLDEIDGLLADEGVRGALLPELDGMKAKGDGKVEPPFVLTIGATNHPERLDAALLSRFGSHIVLVGGADATGRRAILGKLVRKFPVESEELLDWLADDGQTARFSGRDLQNLVKNAVLAMQKEMNPEAGSWKELSEVMGKIQKERPLEKSDFVSGLSFVKGSIDPAEMNRLENWIDDPVPAS